MTNGVREWSLLSFYNLSVEGLTTPSKLCHDLAHDVLTVLTDSEPKEETSYPYNMRQTFQQQL